MLGRMSMEITSTEPRNIYCWHIENFLVFHKQKMMWSYYPLHFQPCTIMWAQKKMLVGARFHRLTAYAQTENVELLCTRINQYCESMEIPTKCHDLALKIACDPITEKCVIKECEDCPSLDLGGSSGLFWSLLLYMEERRKVLWKAADWKYRGGSDRVT